MTCLHKDLLLRRCDQFSYVQWPCSAHTVTDIYFASRPLPYYLLYHQVLCPCTRWSVPQLEVVVGILCLQRAFDTFHMLRRRDCRTSWCRKGREDRGFGVSEYTR